MKFKKAKKMFKKMGVDDVFVKTKADRIREDNWFEVGNMVDTSRPSIYDDSEILATEVCECHIGIVCENLSPKKEKKKKKKSDKKSAYDAEIARIQRNLEFVKTGKGVYEESQEEIARREEQKRENEENQRNRQQQRNNNRNNDGGNQSDQNNTGNNHHQNQNAIRNNRRRNNRSYNNNSSTKEPGTNEVTTKPDYSNKKEE